MMCKHVRGRHMGPTMATLGLVLVLGTVASAATVWDENVDGDLSGDPLNPSAAVLAAGSNTVLASMAAPNDTRDYLAFTVPAGFQLVALLQLN